MIQIDHNQANILNGEHPEGTLTEVQRIDSITEKQFLNDFLKTSKPVIINQGARNWKALQRWSFDYFRSFESDCSITLEEGNVMQETTSFRTVSFQEYINQIQSPTSAEGKIPYLSVFELFKQFPHLIDDVDFSIMSNHKVRNHLTGWIGPGGTVTGYHIDWADNIFAQVVGQKFVKLVSWDQSSYMYPSQKYDSNTLMSSVNADDFDSNRYPNFSKVQAQYAFLDPGDMMFIPRGCWHYVRSLSPSISVNNFGTGWMSFLRDKPREYAKRYLHQIGLYGKECTCHKIVDGRRVSR